MQVKLSQLHKAIAALLMLFFVVYCSVGVCTNMLASSLPPVTPNTVESAHAHHHQMATSGQVDNNGTGQQQAGHCEESGSCEWSINPVADPVSSLDSPAGFFLAYLVTAVCALFLFSPVHLRRRLCYAFSRENFYQQSYPRLHLQKAVFLN